MTKPKQFRLALVPLITNPNRPSRFDLHRHFLGIYRPSLPFTKDLFWVHMDQAAFELLTLLLSLPLPLGFGLDGRLLLARRGRVYV